MCQTNIQTSADSYIGFDSASKGGTINIAEASQLPNSSGAVTYSFTSDNQLQLSASFSLFDPERKGTCLNPTFMIAGVQLFAGFNFPILPSSGVGVEMWLLDAKGTYKISSVMSFVTDGSEILVLTGDTTTSSVLVVQANTDYVLLLSVSSTGATLSTQIIDSVSTL
jgi:hypothetical protein